MRLDVNYYYKYLPTAELILNNRNNAGRPITEMTAIIAVATGVPILAVCYLVEKIKGTCPELEDQKTRMKEFYGYSEVVL